MSMLNNATANSMRNLHINMSTVTTKVMNSPDVQLSMLKVSMIGQPFFKKLSLIGKYYKKQIEIAKASR